MTAHAIELDVRTIPPREKHPAIFRTFDSLEKGEAFVLVNDHVEATRQRAAVNCEVRRGLVRELDR